MRNFVVGCVVLFAMAGPALSETKELPKKLAVDLGGGVKMELVLIPAGEFKMGYESGFDHEKPVHKVTITKPFYLGRYEVTQEQWETVMGNNPSRFKGPKNPVENVNWNDCQQFLGKLNAKVGGQRGRFVLPTEAQWEYACRAGSMGKFCFGDDEARLGDYAWYTTNSGRKTHPVGGKKPNAFGLYDMHGNVVEWCADWYEWSYYAKSPTNDPRGPTENTGGGADRVLRGGCCLGFDRDARSAYRSSDCLVDRLDWVGLRVARVSKD